MKRNHGAEQRLLGKPARGDFGGQALMQRTATGEMGEQEFHLIGKYTVALQVNVFGVRRDERNRKQLHMGLLRGAPSLMVVAALAGSDDIFPVIAAALGDGANMVTGKLVAMKALATIQTKIGVAAKQGAVVQRRDISLMGTVIGAERSYDGVDFNGAAVACFGIDSTTNTIKQRATGIGNLAGMIKSHSLLIVEPLQRQTRYIRPQDILAKRCKHLNHRLLGRCQHPPASVRWIGAIYP